MVYISCGNLQKYQSRNPIQQFFIRRFLNSASNILSLDEDLNLLDVGCAEGFVMNHISKNHSNLNCLGIDLDTNAILKGEILFPELKFQEGDIYNLSFNNGFFK